MLLLNVLVLNLLLYDDDWVVGGILWNLEGSLEGVSWRLLVRLSRLWTLYWFNVGLFLIMLFNWSMMDEFMYLWLFYEHYGCEIKIVVMLWGIGGDISCESYHYVMI